MECELRCVRYSCFYRRLVATATDRSSSDISAVNSLALTSIEASCELAIHNGFLSDFRQIFFNKFPCREIIKSSMCVQLFTAFELAVLKLHVPR